MVPPYSDKVSRASPYSISRIWLFAYGAITRYGLTFQTVLLSFIRLRATPRSLATTCGISVDFFSCGYLDVSVLRVSFHNLWIQLWMTLASRVFPFGNLRIKACLPAPRSLSQATTSFIACCRQGIHQMRLVAWSYNLKHSFEFLKRYKQPYNYFNDIFAVKHLWHWFNLIFIKSINDTVFNYKPNC